MTTEGNMTGRTQPYSHKYMIGTEYGGGRLQTIKHSCPLGLTEDDLRKLLWQPGQIEKFSKYMVGQTSSICEGRRYHHDRMHTENCLNPDNWLFTEPGEQPCDPDSTEYTWRCGYTGTGHYEDDECKDNPHGHVYYASDVERFLRGLPVID